MLYIRVDGNAEIGTGHIMRCLSIANEERNSGGDCTFITADLEMTSVIDEQGFSSICLNSIWNDLDSEIDKMEELVNRLNIRNLLVDSYFVTFKYLKCLYMLTYLTYIDDLNTFIYPCSELINYNIYADRLDYPSRYPNTKLLLGPKYAPLRAEFISLPPRIVRDEVESVLITTGGNDPYNVARQLVEQMQRCSDLQKLRINVVAGRFSKHIAELHELSKKHTNVIVHINPISMAELIRSCDIAVSAGGTTLYELCACGTPTVVFSMADNQVAAVSAFSEVYMLGCGDYRDDGGSCISEMIKNLSRLVRDNNLRMELSSKCYGIIYGD
jgi:UDP-2,4-diacetamido-2,4,6-trideoxy-beta-L-altropyranose hydrolase